MKRSFVYLGLLGALILLGGQLFPAHDIALLRPVRVVYGTSQQGWWYVTTDTGDSGEGATWEEALENLEQTAPGTVFQGTVGYVVLDGNTPAEPLLMDWNLSPNACLCRAQGEVGLEKLGTYLDAHGTLPTIGQLRNKPDTALPVLRETPGGYSLTLP